jgi:hypothetical protein
MADTIVAWVAAALTLMIFSFLYRDNPFYKFAEHLFVGVSAAFWMVYGFWTTLVPNLLGKIWPAWTAAKFPSTGVAAAAEPNYYFLIAGVLGVLMLTRLIQPVAFLSRWALAFIVGWAAGTNLTRYMQSDFIKQIDNTIQPIVSIDPGGDLDIVWTVTSLVVVAGVVCGLVYFFFSKPHRGILGGAGRAGIWVLMITFGASFGYTVMARISLLTGRIEALKNFAENQFLALLRHVAGAS